MMVDAPAPAAVINPEQVHQIVESTRDVFNRAAQPPRWPMYVRQLKQFIRGVDTSFDERKWGFATVMEFLRVCQREGLFRLERDRRGQIRVFPGAGLQSAPISGAPEVAEQPSEQAREVIEAEPVEIVDVPVGQTGTEEARHEEFEAGQSQLTEAAIAEVIEVDEKRAPMKTRRTRKAPTAGKPPARKSTGARTTTRRRKTPVTVG
jgi:hypothetical protein